MGAALWDSYTYVSKRRPYSLWNNYASLPVVTLVSTIELLEREEAQLSEPGDHERFSHYVRKEKIMESALTGEPVRALCGKVWTPGRDPQKFPVCPTCKEIYEGLKPGKDNSDNGDK